MIRFVCSRSVLRKSHNVSRGTASSHVKFSMRRTKASQNYKKTGVRAVQLLLGHTRLRSTVRYLGIEVDDARAISEQVDL
ncbi:hypothetical protein DEV91_15817 [Phyllobacterium brassicacearum]|nr:hypothetical protein DEV91_15817 [Phyllobacterium brassicacearum]